MTIPQLKRLFAVLRANGVSEFSDGKVSVKFAPELPPPVIAAKPAIKRPPQLTPGARAELQQTLKELGIHEGQLAELVEPFREVS